jgi:hypothetical protein
MAEVIKLKFTTEDGATLVFRTSCEACEWIKSNPTHNVVSIEVTERITREEYLALDSVRGD